MHIPENPEKYISRAEFKELTSFVEKQKTGVVDLNNRTAKLADKLFASIDKGIVRTDSGKAVETLSGLNQYDLVTCRNLAANIKLNFLQSKLDLAKIAPGQAARWTAVGKVLSAMKDFFLSLGTELGLIKKDGSESTWGVSSLHQIAKHLKNDLPSLRKNLDGLKEKLKSFSVHMVEYSDAGEAETASLQSGEGSDAGEAETASLQSGEGSDVDEAETASLQSGEGSDVDEAETASLQSGEGSDVDEAETASLQSEEGSKVLGLSENDIKVKISNLEAAIAVIEAEAKRAGQNGDNEKDSPSIKKVVGGWNNAVAALMSITSWVKKESAEEMKKGDVKVDDDVSIDDEI